MAEESYHDRYFYGNRLPQGTTPLGTARNLVPNLPTVTLLLRTNTTTLSPKVRYLQLFISFLPRLISEKLREWKFLLIVSIKVSSFWEQEPQWYKQ